jgi:hypothetical protein
MTMMRSRSLAVVSALLLFAAGADLRADEKKPAATVPRPADALWRFNTHG